MPRRILLHRDGNLLSIASRRFHRLFSLGNKLVPHPVNRPKEHRAARIRLDFLPQFCNAVVYCSVAGPSPLWPDRADQFLPRDHNFGSGNKKSQHLELLQSESYRLIGATEFHPSEIKKDLAELRPCKTFSGNKVGHLLVVALKSNQCRAYVSARELRGLSQNCHILVKSARLG